MSRLSEEHETTIRIEFPVRKTSELLVEVSDSTLDRDRGAKSAAYAKGRIPVYWIVNLVDRQVEVYTHPSPSGYASRVDFKPGEEIPVVLDGVEIGRIAVASILPSR